MDHCGCPVQTGSVTEQVADELSGIGRPIQARKMRIVLADAEMLLILPIPGSIATSYLEIRSLLS